MKDVSKPYRLAIFAALTGQLTYNTLAVPVYDEKQAVTGDEKVFVLLSTQTSTPERADNLFARHASIDIEIIAKTGSEISKDVIDDVGDEILTILFPSYGVFGVTVPSGWQFAEAFYDSEISRVFEISQTESILRKIIKISAIIVQQL